MDKKARELAAKLYATGMSDAEIADACNVRPFDIRDLAIKEGWAEKRHLDRFAASAQALKEDAAANAKFRTMADAIQSLAAAVAKKKQSGVMTAKDVLDLARAAELAQRIRMRTRGDNPAE